MQVVMGKGLISRIAGTAHWSQEAATRSLDGASIKRLPSAHNGHVATVRLHVLLGRVSLCVVSPMRLVARRSQPNAATANDTLTGASGDCC